MEPLLTTEDVAEWLRMDVVTVRRLIGRGELPAYRVGGEYRFKRADLEAYLEEQRVPPGDRSRLGKFMERAGKLVTLAHERDRFGEFTDRARNALALAQEEARQLDHNYIGTEHVLLGLLREGKGVAAKVLTNLNVELEDVRSAVKQLPRVGARSGDPLRMVAGKPEDGPVCGEMPVTPRTKKVLELAVDEARRLGHQYIGTEHLLLGVVREGHGVGTGVLQSRGVDLEKVRAETMRLLEAMRA